MTGVQGQNPYRFNSGVIHEEDEDLPANISAGLISSNAFKDTSAADDDTDQSTDTTIELARKPSSRLRRIASHESIMSLSGGLDIHTLQIRPSQMSLRPPLQYGADAVVTGVIAQPTMSTSYSKRSDAALRNHFAGFQQLKRSSTPTSDISVSSSQASRIAATGGLGKWVGWRPWGGAASPSEGQPKPEKEAPKVPNRAPGINQPGAIPGFEHWIAQQRRSAAAGTTAGTANRSALSESLRDAA